AGLRRGPREAEGRLPRRPGGRGRGRRGAGRGGHVPMKEPEVVLRNGTRVVTNATLDSTRGLMVVPRALEARRPSTPGLVVGIVPGHGGDVYWVRHHADGVVAAYCFTEFELAPAPKTVPERIAAQKALCEAFKVPMFAPADGVCWVRACRRQIY